MPDDFERDVWENGKAQQENASDNSDEAEKRRLANLRPFQPGQSGNPGGRPKKKPITELYEEMLNDPEMVDILRAAIRKAIGKGSMAMVLQVKEMTDRVEGKVTQPIEADVTVNLADAIAEARKRAGK